MRLKALKCALVLSCLAMTVIADPMDAEELSPAELNEGFENIPRDERIFAYYTSTSLTRLTTTTITAVSTCFSTSPDGPTCQGRKKRSGRAKNLELLEEDFNFTDLDTSQEEPDHEGYTPDIVEIEEEDENGKKSGRKLTIWSTNFTTLTITSTSALAGTTVTITALCNLAGQGQSCFLG